MASIHRRANGNWVLIDQRFRPRRWVNLGPITHQEAKRVLLRYETDQTYLKLDLPVAPSRITLKELADEYEAHIKPAKAEYTVYLEARVLSHLCKNPLRDKTFGQTFISDITTADIENYIHEKGYTAYSAHNVAKSLKGAYKLAVAKKYINRSPVEAVRLPKIEELAPKCLDPALIEKLFKVMSGRILAYYKILYYTGLRPGEALRLKKADVDLKNGRLFVVKSKTKKFRVLPIHPKLKPFLKALMGESEYLFEFRGEQQKSMKMGLRRAIDDAKLQDKGISAYAFRHTFATQVLSKTSNLRAVQTLLGHSRSTMTERYAHVLNEQLKDAVEKL